MENTEDIQASVSAAFDSVAVINDSTSDADTIARNKEHLTIMLGKDYFLEALTEVQATELQTASE